MSTGSEKKEQCVRKITDLKTRVSGISNAQSSIEQLNATYGNINISKCNKCIFLMYALELMHIDGKVEIIERCSDDYLKYLNKEKGNRSSERDEDNILIKYGYPQKARILDRDAFVDLLIDYIIYPTLKKDTKASKTFSDKYFDDLGWGIYCPTFYNSANVKFDKWKTYFTKKKQEVERLGRNKEATWGTYLQSLPLPMFPPFITRGSIIEFLGIQKQGSKDINRLWNNRKLKDTGLNWMDGFTNFDRMNLFFENEDVFPSEIIDTFNNDLFSPAKKGGVSSSGTSAPHKIVKSSLSGTPTYAGAISMTPSPSQSLHRLASYSTPIAEVVSAYIRGPSPNTTDWDTIIQRLDHAEKTRIRVLCQNIDAELMRERGTGRSSLNTKPRESRTAEIQATINQYMKDQDDEEEEAFVKHVDSVFLSRDKFPSLVDYGRPSTRRPDTISHADWNATTRSQILSILNEKYRAFFKQRYDPSMEQGTYNHLDKTWNTVLYTYDMRNVIQTLYQILYSPDFLRMQTTGNHRLKFLVGVLRQMNVFACEEFRYYTMHVLKSMLDEINQAEEINSRIESFNIDNLITDLTHAMDLIKFSWGFRETKTGVLGARTHRRNIFVDIDVEDLEEDKDLNALCTKNQRAGDISDYRIPRRADDFDQIMIALDGFSLASDPPFFFFDVDDEGEGKQLPDMMNSDGIFSTSWSPVPVESKATRRYKQRHTPVFQSDKGDQRSLGAAWGGHGARSQDSDDDIAVGMSMDDTAGSQTGVLQRLIDINTTGYGGAGMDVDIDATPVQKKKYMSNAIRKQEAFFEKYLNPHIKQIYDKLCNSLEETWFLHNVNIREIWYATVKIRIEGKEIGIAPLPLLAVSIRLQKKAMESLKPILEQKRETATKARDRWTVWIMDNIDSILKFWETEGLHTVIPIEETAKDGFNHQTSFHAIPQSYMNIQNYVNKRISKPYISRDLKNPWLQLMKQGNALEEEEEEEEETSTKRGRNSKQAEYEKSKRIRS